MIDFERKLKNAIDARVGHLSRPRQLSRKVTRRITLRRVTLVGGSSVLVLALLAGTGIGITKLGDDGGPAVGPSETAEEDNQEARLEQLVRLESDLLQLQVQLEEMRGTRAETVASLQAARDRGATLRVRELKELVEILDARIATLLSEVNEIQARLRTLRGVTDRSQKRDETASAYPLLYSHRGLNIYAPGKGHPWGWCPERPLPLREDHMVTAGQVIRIAARVFVEEGVWEPQFKKAKLVDVRVGPGGVFIPQRNACGLETASRTVVAGVSFPKVAKFSASMGFATFYLSREQRGWVIWDWPN
jgi:hypothetical protein